MDEVLALTSEMERNAGAPSVDLDRVASRLRLPSQYCAFLREHDGAEGFIGPSYARFYGTAQLEEDAEAGGLDHFVGWTVFGTNGAGEAFAFDERGNVQVVPWIGAREDAIPQGSLTDFVRRLMGDAVFDR
jgi:hypothetical protein